jgi:hypothetical protein
VPTVQGLMLRTAAIVLLVSPSAIIPAISFSRGLSLRYRARPGAPRVLLQGSRGTRRSRRSRRPTRSRPGGHARLTAPCPAPAPLRSPSRSSPRRRRPRPTSGLRHPVVDIIAPLIGS